MLGVAVAVAGDVVIFAWLLVELPDVEVPRRIELRGALLAAVAFEVLKIVGSYTIAHTASSPTAGPFAGILAVLIWIQLVARSLLFSCAWTAVVAAEDAAARQPAVPAALTHEGARPRTEPPLVGAEARLLGRGAAIGAAGTWVLMRLRAQRAAARVLPSRRAP